MLQQKVSSFGNINEGCYESPTTSAIPCSTCTIKVASRDFHHKLKEAVRAE